MYTLSDVVHIIIIFQGALLAAFILFFYRKSSKGDFILATIFGTLSIQILGIMLANRQIGSSFFPAVNCIYGFLYGPLLFLYNRSITRAEFKFRINDLMHFIPAAITLLGVAFTNGALCQPRISVLYAIHILTYVGLCFFEVRKYKQVIGDNYSRLEWLNLGWLQWVFIVFTGIVLADVIQFISLFLGWPIPYLEQVVFILILAAINLLYFYGITPTRRAAGFSKEDLALSSSIASRTRIDTTLPENQALVDKLENHMHSEESFKNPNLTIDILAKELNMPKRNLSELINDHYDQNFVDFVNTYRVNSAKQRLMSQSDPKETILEILYAVGFNSKSSFNQAFKKKTGVTPTEYRSRQP